MSIRQEEPPASGRGKTSEVWPDAVSLAEKAIANRGEWFACDIPDDVTTGNAWSYLRNIVYGQLDGIDLKVRDGVAYLRIGENL